MCNKSLFGHHCAAYAQKLLIAKAREVQISTHSWGQLHHKGVEILADDSDIGRSADTGYETKRRLAYLPAFGQ